MCMTVGCVFIRNLRSVYLARVCNIFLSFIMDSTSQNDLAQRSLTFGEKAVGLTFNPSGDADVQEVKQIFAELIDKLALARAVDGISPDKARLFSVAITEAQTAQMWAVKAITWKD